VLELFLLGVLHDRPRLRILLESEALLVPVDRLGLLDERDADPSEGAYLFGKLVGRLVILLERHSAILPRGALGKTRTRYPLASERHRRNTLSAGLADDGPDPALGRPGRLGARIRD